MENNFEKLPVEVLLHLMEFCSGKDLLRLSETCTAFKDIIFNESKLMKKIRFKIEIGWNKIRIPKQNWYGVTKVLNERKISAVKLIISFKNINKAMFSKKNYDMILSTLRNLSLVTEDLSIKIFTSSTASKSVYRGIINIFLPKLKSLEMFNLQLIDDEDKEITKEFPSDPVPDGFDYPLKTLKMDVVDPEVFECFSGCRKVKTLMYSRSMREYFCDHRYVFMSGLVDDFLMKQRFLKVLHWTMYYENSPITAAWLNVPFKLHELLVYCFNDEIKLGILKQFLQQQDELKNRSDFNYLFTSR